MTEPTSTPGLTARLQKRLAWMWVNFWLTRSGRGFFGRIATRFAVWGYPPYKGRVALAQVHPKGYVAASAAISHTNLTMGNNIFVGDAVIIYQHAAGGSVRLGDRVMLFDGIIIETFPGGSLSIGADTAIQPRCHFTAALAPIRIGNDVQIAPQCAFYSYDHGILPGESISAQPLRSNGPIIIEDGAWLGVGVIVLSGVRIGTGAVVGAGSVVTRDVPDNAVAVGSPARVIKMRGELTEVEQIRFLGARR